MLARPYALVLFPVVLTTLACFGGPASTPLGPDPDGIVTHTPTTEPPEPSSPPAAQSTPLSDAQRPRRTGPSKRGSAASRSPAAPAPAPAGTAAVESPPPSDAVRLDRRALEQDLAGVESLGEVIRLRPHLTWKGIDGIQVADIPPGSPLVGVGLQKGDVVHRVNGRSLTSIDAAWSLGEVLQTADVLEGEITRNGQRQRLVVHLD